MIYEKDEHPNTSEVSPLLPSSNPVPRFFNFIKDLINNSSIISLNLHESVLSHFHSHPLICLDIDHMSKGYND